MGGGIGSDFGLSCLWEGGGSVAAQFPHLSPKFREWSREEVHVCIVGPGEKQPRDAAGALPTPLSAPWPASLQPSPKPSLGPPHRERAGDPGLGSH